MLSDRKRFPKQYTKHTKYQRKKKSLKLTVFIFKTS